MNPLRRVFYWCARHGALRASATSLTVVAALVTADQVMAGKVPDPTGGATHYYATTMPKPPDWAAKDKQTLKLGHHVFFKDVP